MKVLDLALIIIFVLNMANFVLYGIDKAASKRKSRRIPESLLLFLGLIGGGLGGILAMEIFNHKTRKFKFYIVNILGIVMVAYLLIYLIRL